MKKKHVKWVLIAAVLVIGAVFIMRSQSSDAQAQAPGHQMLPTEVAIVTIAPQSVTYTKDLPGRTSAFRVAEIRPQVSGIITKRLFEEGSDVEEGQQLYQIDPAPYQAVYDSARADLMKAQANIKSVEARAQRFKELVKIGGVSKQEYDDVSASLEQSKADIAIARAALATAKINLDYTKVFSPISGRIGQSLVTEGALVTAGQASALATVQQFDKIYVDVMQSSEELMRLRRQFAKADGQFQRPTARLVVDGKEYSDVEGVLQFSDVTVNQSTGTVQLRILFENADLDLLPGLFVHARIPQSTIDGAILVSQKAVTRHPDNSVTVFVVDENDTVGIRPIQVSQVVRDQWLVTGGLQAGDRVVVEGIMKIGPGMKVKPVEKDAAPQEAQQLTPQLTPLEGSAEEQEAPSAEAPPEETVSETEAE